ncbi:hypothetical protein SCHPADRAFT_1001782 [Schizopora paradoxa]|uniref:Uncharacterized protein n=1 Tax=Schizopora paradoxa TaxID=27342 RepID=A0A0H2RCR1_9AGAM|nr:hypothetical protein SCHPADRAFT_1001782 [Schizopora paradoxa]
MKSSDNLEGRQVPEEARKERPLGCKRAEAVDRRAKRSFNSRAALVFPSDLRYVLMNSFLSSLLLFPPSHISLLIFSLQYFSAVRSPTCSAPLSRRVSVLASSPQDYLDLDDSTQILAPYRELTSNSKRGMSSTIFHLDVEVETPGGE